MRALDIGRVPTHVPYETPAAAAVAALVLAIAGFLGLPVVPSVMAIRIVLRARRELADQSQAAHRRLAVAAVVLGFAELVAAVVIVALLIWAPLLVPSG
jgi:hypothetical protein